MISQSNIFSKVPNSVAHTYVSWIGTTLIGNAVNDRIHKPTLSTWIGSVSMFGIGLGKEYIWDKKMGKGVFNKMDIADNAWGCALGLVTCRVVIDIKDNKKKKKLNIYSK